jgi:DNA polymerase
MIEQPAISPAKPPRPSAAPRAEPAASPLAAAAAAIHDCRRCNLWQPATQPVFGEGPVNARIMFIGEQPGDQEDLGGRPFIGPAGQLFDRAMAEAGLDRATVYVTNAVKHFKFVPRGKRRIHDKPGISEITACKFWLDLERAEIAPALTVMLGATAARAVLGRAVTITRERSRPLPLDANRTGFITVHPSYLLRLPDEDAKAREYQAFVNDLRTVKELAA